MFLERFFELPVCTRLSDTKPLTYRVWDMLVDLNLYVQTINHRPYEFSREHRFMRYWINHNAAVKNKTVQPVPKIQPVLRWLDPVFLVGYHPTLKLSGIPHLYFYRKSNT